MRSPSVSYKSLFHSARFQEDFGVGRVCLAAGGGEDFACNNAGASRSMGTDGRARIYESTDEDWDCYSDMFLKGLRRCMKHEIEVMLPAGQGVIVNNASVADVVGGPSAAYSTVKHGVVGLTRSASRQYAFAGDHQGRILKLVPRFSLLVRLSSVGTVPGAGPVRYFVHSSVAVLFNSFSAGTTSSTCLDIANSWWNTLHTTPSRSMIKVALRTGAIPNVQRRLTPKSAPNAPSESAMSGNGS